MRGKRMKMEKSMKRLKIRIVQAGSTQGRLGVAMGIDPGMISRIMAGLRAAPPDFEKNAIKTLKLLEQAQKAADDARLRVMKGSQ